MAGEKHAAFMIFMAGLMWSFAGVLLKFTTWSSLTIVGFRALSALVILGAARRSFKIVTKPAVLIGGLGYTVTAILFILSNKLTSAANAIVLQYAMPVFVLVISAVMFKQKPARSEVIAILIVLLGVVLCFVEGLGNGALLGDSLALLSALTFTPVFFAARLGKCDPFDYAYLGCVLSLPCLLCIPFDAGFDMSGQHLLVALALGICLGVGCAFFSTGMKAGLSPVKAAIIANVEPVMNPVWAFVFCGENPGIWSIIGAVLVLGAVTVYSLISSKQQAASA